MTALQSQMEKQRLRQMVNDHKNSVYACLNYNEAYCPRQIEGRSVCIDGDTADVLNDLK